MNRPRGLLALTVILSVVPDGSTIGRALRTTSPGDSPAPAKADSEREDPQSRMAVRLVDGRGQPVAGAVASDFLYRDADHDPSFMPMEPTAAPTSDARGELTLTLDVPDHRDATAVYAIRRDGDRPLVGVQRVTREDLRGGKPVTVVMHPACRVRLRVECPGFRELEEKFHVELGGAGWWRAAYVWVGENDRAARPLFTSSTNGELEFLLPPGRYMIMAYGSDVTSVRRVVEVQPGHRVLSLGVLEVSPSDEIKRGNFRGFWRSIRRDQQADREGRRAGEGRIVYRRPRGGVLLKGDSSHAWDVAYSPDGKLLATAHSRHEDPGEVKLWDTATGAMVAMWTARGRGVLSVAFSPDGRLLAGRVAARNEPQSWPRVVLWDVASRRELHTLLGGPYGGIQAMAFSPDGKVLATVGGDRIVRFSDPWTGREAGRVDGIASDSELAFSPDGRSLVMNDASDAFTLWDIPGKRLRATLEPGADLFRVRSVAFAPDGRTLVAAGQVNYVRKDGHQSRVRFYDLTRDPPARRAELTLEHGAPARLSLWASDVAFTPDGRRMIALMIDSIAIWDAATGNQRDSLQRSGSLADQLAISPDGRWMATTQRVGVGVAIQDLSPTEP